MRNGRLMDFQAVGEKGKVVFDVALQIRETLRLRHQTHIADCLAIPQPNGRGDVAWYAPLPGRVTSWGMANSEQRQQALSVLERMVADAQALSQHCLDSENAAWRRFGVLLGKALQFPAENYIYLVDGRPVITFWGFVNLNQPVRETVLDCLAPDEPPERQTPPPPATSGVALYNAVAHGEVAEQPEPETALPLAPSQEAPAVVERPTQEPPPQAATGARRKRWRPTVIAALVLVAAGAVLVPVFDAHRDVILSPRSVVDNNVAPVVTLPLPTLDVRLPLAQAQVIAPPAPEPVTPAPPPPPVAVEPPPKNALVMDAWQVYAGHTQFLDGTWRVSITTPPVGRQFASLRYQIKDNHGSARVVLDNGAICKTTLFAGLHKNGVLMIKPRMAAHCSNGQRFPLPEFSCRMGDGPAAQCSALYDENTVSPALFRKVAR